MSSSRLLLGTKLRKRLLMRETTSVGGGRGGSRGGGGGGGEGEGGGFGRPIGEGGGGGNGSGEWIRGGGGEREGASGADEGGGDRGGGLVGGGYGGGLVGGGYGGGIDAHAVAATAAARQRLRQSRSGVKPNCKRTCGSVGGRGCCSSASSSSGSATNDFLRDWLLLEPFAAAELEVLLLLPIRLLFFFVGAAAFLRVALDGPPHSSPSDMIGQQPARSDLPL